MGMVTAQKRANTMTTKGLSRAAMKADGVRAAISWAQGDGEEVDGEDHEELVAGA